MTFAWGLFGAVTAVLDDKLHVCGGGGGGATASCYALHGSSWEKQSSLRIPRQNAGGSRWMGGWLVTGGIDFNTRHRSSELYTGGSWTAGPDMVKLWSWSSGEMGSEGHCQVTVGSKVIVAGKLWGG